MRIISTWSQNGIHRKAINTGRASLAIVCMVGVMMAFGENTQAVDIVETTEIIDLEVHKGTILRLDRDAETVFVSDPEIVDVQPRSKRTLFVYGLQTGETTLFALDKNDQPILASKLTVNHNITSLTGMIKRMSPDSQVTTTSVPHGIILEGKVQTPQDADQITMLAQQYVGDGESIINQLSVLAPTQVNLRIKIVEASRETVRALGVQWQTETMGQFAFAGVTGLPSFASDASNNAFGFDYLTNGGDNITAFIDALDTEGVLSILAEPNLTAISGETASFLAGGEFPVPVGIDDNKIEIQFKEFGVSLAFTPIVLSGNQISLKVRSEVSQLSEAAGIVLNGASIPGLSTRRADTTVELASGQSFALAGLIQKRKTNDISKVPGLGSIPLLGKLFQSRRFQQEETELIIIATPYLVRPVNPTTPLRSPVNQGAASQQFEQLLRSPTPSSVSGNSSDGAADGQGLSSPVGFIME